MSVQDKVNSTQRLYIAGRGGAGGGKGSAWEYIENKPFDTLDTSDFKSVNGQLQLVNSPKNTTATPWTSGTYTKGTRRANRGYIWKVKDSVSSTSQEPQDGCTDWEKTILADDISELNSKITNLIKTKTVVNTTDSDGDCPLISKDNIVVSVGANRNYGSDAFTGFFATILTKGNTGDWQIKCIKDDTTNLANTKVAVDVYYI